MPVANSLPAIAILGEGLCNANHDELWPTQHGGHALAIASQKMPWRERDARIGNSIPADSDGKTAGGRQKWGR